MIRIVTHSVYYVFLSEYMHKVYQMPRSVRCQRQLKDEVRLLALPTYMVHKGRRGIM